MAGSQWACRLFPDGEEALLFHPGEQALYALDGAGAAVAEALAAGLSPAAILASLGYTPATAPPGWTDLLQWLTAPPPPDPLPLAYPNDLVDFPPIPGGGHGAGPRAFQLLGASFTVGGADYPGARWLASVLAALPAAAQAEFAVTVARPARGTYRIAVNGRAFAQPRHPLQVVPFLINTLRRLAYQRHPFLLAVHGAVLRWRGQGWLVPGVSGTGKSTLAMALAGAGAAVLTDETAVLREAGLSCPAIPLPVGLKAGSWAVVAADFPGLFEQPVFARGDGQRLRYLSLPPAPAATPIQQLVFPVYRPGEPPGCQALTPVGCFRGLAEAGYHVHRTLDGAKAARLVAWLRGVRGWRVQYPDSAAAVGQLERLAEWAPCPPSMS